jgi:translation initiation factor 2 subunit 2
MDYEKLLDKAYSALPQRVLQAERFEPPVADVFMQGNKTIIKNFDVILEKLRRKPEMLIKYLSRELAIPATVEGGKLILHGKFYDKKINEKLSSFISSYVVCKECNRPDTKIIEEHHGLRTMVCEACGARMPVK